MKAKVVLLIFSIVLFFSGIGIICGGIHLNKNVDYFKENGICILAKVVSVTYISESYYADVIYSAYGKEYSANYNTSTYIKEGDLVKIYYDKNNPSNYHHTISNTGPIIMIIIGVITFIVGVIILYLLIRKLIKSKAIS